MKGLLQDGKINGLPAIGFPSSSVGKEVEYVMKKMWSDGMVWYDATDEMFDSIKEEYRRIIVAIPAVTDLRIQIAFGTDKPFFISNFRVLLDLFDKQEISMSKVVEELNVIAYKWADSRVTATAPTRNPGESELVNHAYNKTYPSEVIYHSDKNFIVRLKAMTERTLKHLGIKVSSEKMGELMDIIGNEAEDCLFEKKVRIPLPATGTQDETAEQIIKRNIPNGIVNFKAKGKGDGKPQYEAEIAVIKKCMQEYASQSQQTGTQGDGDLINISFVGSPKSFGDKYGKQMADDLLFTEAILALLGTYCSGTGHSVEFLDGNGESIFYIEKK